MALTDKFRNLLGGAPAAELLAPLRAEGVWPRGGVQRYVCQGIPEALLEGFEPHIRSGEDWREVFGEAAKRYRAMGDKHRDGDPNLAGRYYLIAAACAFHAQLLRLGDERREAGLRHQCRTAFALAAEFLRPVAQPMQAIVDGRELLGFYRATTEQAHGTVVLLNSQQSCKEDMYYFTQPLLELGMNTLLIDTPGTGTAMPQFAFSGVSGLWEGLQVGLARLSGAMKVPTLLLGAGAGAAVALQLAARHPKAFRAVALLSPPHDLRLVAERLKPWVRAELCTFLGCADADVADALRLLDCTGLAERVRMPVLILGAAKDEDFPRRQSKRLADEFGPKRAEYWGSGSATHCLYEKQPQLRQRIAQWLGKQVGSHAARNEFIDAFSSQPGD